MLPIQSNTNQSGCDPISSNCVIWQGPDIPCIDLCKGDSISDVIAKLAQELCDLLDQTGLTGFDLTCFNPICPTPENFHDLIQVLINKICLLENVNPEPIPGTAGCPDCIVSIAPCFYFLNPVGDQITTMQLRDYVTAIGNKICTQVQQIVTINATLTNLDNRVTVIEQNCCNQEPLPELLLPVDCVIADPPPEGVPVSTLVIAIEEAFCELRSATGLPNDIFASIAKQCGGLDTSPTLNNHNINMGSLPGWVTQANYSNLADSINNMWLTICDLRQAVFNIQANCCPTGCEGVDITMTAVKNGSNIDVSFTGSVPPGFHDCTPLPLTITDSGSGKTVNSIAVIANLNGGPVSIPIAPLDPNSNYNLSLAGCFTDGSNTCEQIITYYLVNDALCTPLNVVTTTHTIDWQFNNPIVGTITYTVELWNQTGTTLLDSQTATTSNASISGEFSVGINDDTTYLIRQCIQVGVNPAICCPFVTVTTLPGSYWAWDSDVNNDLFIQADGSFWLLT